MNVYLGKARLSSEVSMMQDCLSVTLPHSHCWAESLLSAVEESTVFVAVGTSAAVVWRSAVYVMTLEVYDC